MRVSNSTASVAVDYFRLELFYTLNALFSRSTNSICAVYQLFQLQLLITCDNGEDYVFVTVGLLPYSKKLLTDLNEIFRVDNTREWKTLIEVEDPLSQERAAEGGGAKFSMLFDFSDKI